MSSVISEKDLALFKYVEDRETFVFYENTNLWNEMKKLMEEKNFFELTKKIHSTQFINLYNEIAQFEEDVKHNESIKEKISAIFAANRTDRAKRAFKRDAFATMLSALRK